MLDSIDAKILRMLQNNARITVTDLASAIGLSKTPCTERIRRLEREGYLAGYHAQIDPAMVGLATVIFVQVTLDRSSTDMLDKFNRAVKQIPEVESVHMIAGGFDYLIKVRARDMAHYRRVLGDHIGVLPGVSQTQTYPVMETVKEDRGINPVLL